MRWFKHMSDASDDEFIAQLEEELGLEGYARWWKLLEVIAKQMDKTERCFASYPVSKWMALLSCKQRKVLETFLNVLQKFDKISTNYQENILKIECPKLLDFRDEYSRKSGHTPENVAPETEAEAEAEAETNKKKNTSISPKKKAAKQMALIARSQLPISPKNPDKPAPNRFSEFYKTYPPSEGMSRQRAYKAYEIAIQKHSEDMLIKAAAIYAHRREFDVSDEFERIKFTMRAWNWLSEEQFVDLLAESPMQKPDTSQMTQQQRTEQILREAGIS